jgi:hypothetical protein
VDLNFYFTEDEIRMLAELVDGSNNSMETFIKLLENRCVDMMAFLHANDFRTYVRAESVKVLKELGVQ